MRKGIYQEKNGKWYISTKIKIGEKYQHCTIRGFNSKKEADINYDFAISKWKKEHNLYENEKDDYESLRNEFLYYRGLEISRESVRKDETQFRTYWDMIFAKNTATNIFDLPRLEIIYKNIVNNKTINNRKKSNIVKTFRDFTFFCYKKKIINHELYQDIDLVFRPIKFSKQVEKEKRVISDSEIKAFLGAINRNHKDLPMFTLFVSLGARLSEFLGILVNCYDRQNKKIEIKRQLLTNGSLSDKLKTANSYRKILIADNVAEMLNEYIDNNLLKENDRLFKISHIEFKRRLRKYEDLAKIPHYSSHEFRHTRATKLAAKCVNMSDVIYCAGLLGHSKAMFLDTYCHDMNTNESKFLG